MTRDHLGRDEVYRLTMVSEVSRRLVAVRVIRCGRCRALVPFSEQDAHWRSLHASAGPKVEVDDAAGVSKLRLATDPARMAEAVRLLTDPGALRELIARIVQQVSPRPITAGRVFNNPDDGD